MSDVTLERMQWRVEALEKKMETEAASRFFVREEVLAATSPINDALVKMERTLEKMGDQIKQGHETQDVLMKERAEREKNEYEARMVRQQEKHEAEMSLVAANLEEAKNQTFFNRATKQWYPLLLVLASLATIINQFVLPALRSMNGH